jgi:hypothetical protein
LRQGSLTSSNSKAKGKVSQGEDLLRPPREAYDAPEARAAESWIMEHKLPPPTCKAFLICRQVLLDKYTQEYSVLGVTHQVVAPTYPHVAVLSIFAQCTAVPGRYVLELQLQDLEANVVWRNHFDEPLQVDDPLKIGILTLQHQHIYFPRPGKYDLILLANGEEVVRVVLWAFTPAVSATPRD